MHITVEQLFRTEAVVDANLIGYKLRILSNLAQVITEFFFLVTTNNRHRPALRFTFYDAL